MIIDAHAHITKAIDGITTSGRTRSLEYGKIAWGKETFRLLPPLATISSFPAEVLLEYMNSAGVEKSVLLQSGFYGDTSAYIAETVARWPDRFVGAGFVDPTSPDARTDFTRCVDEYGFHVLKFEMSVSTGLVGLHPSLRLAGDEMAWIWEESEKRGLVITLDLGAIGSASYQTDGLREIVERHPRLRFVVAHLAQPPVANPNDDVLIRLWEEQIALARHPNIWFDLSALPGYASAVEDYPFPTAAAFVKQAVDAVGADRLLWGTDVPGLLMAATYLQLLRFVTVGCELTEDERKRILGLNARDVYLA